MKIIVVNNEKGGCLKTTLVTHLASVLVNEGKNVLIVDCDSQSNVSLSFNVNADKLRYTLYDVLVHDVDIKKVIVNVYWKNATIDVLPSNNTLRQFESTLKVRDREGVLKAKLEQIRDDYDYILIDTPPTDSLIVDNAFNCADEIIIPFQPEQYSRRSLLNTLEKANKYNVIVKGVVPTIVELNTNLHKDIIEATKVLSEKMGFKVTDTIIPKSIQYASSIGYDGRPIILTKPNNKLSKTYKTLWEEINNG